MCEASRQSSVCAPEGRSLGHSEPLRGMATWVQATRKPRKLCFPLLGAPTIGRHHRNKQQLFLQTIHLSFQGWTAAAHSLPPLHSLPPFPAAASGRGSAISGSPTQKVSKYLNFSTPVQRLNLNRTCSITKLHLPWHKRGHKARPALELITQPRMGTQQCCWPEQNTSKALFWLSWLGSLMFSSRYVHVNPAMRPTPANAMCLRRKPHALRLSLNQKQLDRSDQPQSRRSEPDATWAAAVAPRLREGVQSMCSREKSRRSKGEKQ